MEGEWACEGFHIGLQVAVRNLMEGEWACEGFHIGVAYPNGNIAWFVKGFT